jgi:hypothetical protein
MTDEDLLQQLVMFVRFHPKMNIHLHIYSTSLILQGGYDREGNETLHRRIAFVENPNLSTELHELCHDLKELAEKQL